MQVLAVDRAVLPRGPGARMLTRARSRSHTVVCQARGSPWRAESAQRRQQAFPGGAAACVSPADTQSPQRAEWGPPRFMSTQNPRK